MRLFCCCPTIRYSILDHSFFCYYYAICGLRLFTRLPTLKHLFQIYLSIYRFAPPQMLALLLLLSSAYLLRLGLYYYSISLFTCSPNPCPYHFWNTFRRSRRQHLARRKPGNFLYKEARAERTETAGEQLVVIIIIIIMGEGNRQIPVWGRRCAKKETTGSTREREGKIGFTKISFLYNLCREAVSSHPLLFPSHQGYQGHGDRLVGWVVGVGGRRKSPDI